MAPKELPIDQLKSIALVIPFSTLVIYYHLKKRGHEDILWFMNLFIVEITLTLTLAALMLLVGLFR